MMTRKGTFGIFGLYDDSPLPSSEEEFLENLSRSTIGLEPTERPVQPFDREQLRRNPAAEIEPEHKTPETDRKSVV